MEFVRCVECVGCVREKGVCVCEGNCGLFSRLVRCLTVVSVPSVGT